MSWSNLLSRARQSPHLIIHGIMALSRGLLVKAWFRLSGRDVRIGRRFRVTGPFYFQGAGKLRIGDDCMINSRLFKPACFLAVDPHSTITIGDNVTFSGTSIQCYEIVEIGDDCSIANAYIVDSPCHHMTSDRRVLGEKGLHHSPVKIGRNVWISVNVVITHGVTIGDNSVVGACALVRSMIPPNKFFAGVPAKEIKDIEPSRLACQSELGGAD
jgi:acetyltransferase-like isoleucine patch superfamily enzyme